MPDVLTNQDFAPDLAEVPYFSLTWYDRLHAIVSFWLELSEVPQQLRATQAERAFAEQLLFTEARLLDQERLEEWLTLFTDDAVYWIPADVQGRDPRTTVSWELNDRRRLEERVERLATERAYSQAPSTRTTHLYSNLEVLSFEPGIMHVICRFFIQTSLAGKLSPRAGWNGYILRKVDDDWRIAMKRIGLFDADCPQDNNSFTL
ncbi:aromatic-ring-hydroxylating dioxygenase subunit beta [Bradyrhizobium quebecense]|uniref:Nuclear transport factor 2 family protein n=2 Tax=Bradyrhizobium quebecense TaxID=2748629 RepID=A0ACD3V7W2_9BRAD|nr:aromatic-ring-hydroxylating dioxygenase subunit beta [Bradyrhizobium quebecense]UGY02510.1 nuclear transport factor 2 family protein [Bradyrhizobium quebecense]